MSQPTVIILASGRGERFAQSGGRYPKLQALLVDKTVLQHTLDAVRASGLPWHLEDVGHPGMGDSIAAAVRATLQSSPQPTGWLILPGDLPLIRSDTLRQIGEALGSHQVVVPVYRKRRGHPVGFSMCCRSELLDLKGNEGARNVVLAYEATELMVDDIGCVTDIDTVADLHAVEKLLNGMTPLAADTF